VILILIGAAILLLLSFVKFGGRDLSLDFVRDLAIALTVGGFVACLFEIYHHITYEMRTMSEVIDTVMGDKITPDVWREVKNLMERRTVIRRDVRIRLSLQMGDGLEEHQAILRVEHDYNLCGLSSHRVSARIEHELDYHLQPALDLPRFEHVGINPPGPGMHQWDRETLKRDFPDGKFSYELTVEPSGEEPVRVQTQRLELVYVPGSYNFYSAEFVKGLQLTFGVANRC